MSQDSAIEWTDATWNPVRGCTKVSPGCANCYAETFAERWRGVKGHPYEQGFDLRLVPEKLDEPLHWKKPRRVFVNSMSDLFHDGVPDEFIGKVFDVMARAPQHTFQILTKRPERMRVVVPTFAWRHTALDGSGWPLPNVWLGVSVENQHFANMRIPPLLKTPAAVRFISAEPLLEDVLLDNGDTSWLTCTSKVQQREGGDCCMAFMEQGEHFHGIDWVIVGGESGHGARPFDVAWARSIVAQCKAAGVPVFVKQLGGHAETDSMADLNGHIARGPRWLVLKGKGGDPSEWPDDLRVRQFPRIA